MPLRLGFFILPELPELPELLEDFELELLEFEVLFARHLSKQWLGFLLESNEFKDLLLSPEPFQDHRLEPFQGKAREIRENIVNLMSIGFECPWAIKEVELALDEEAFELLRVQAIKGVRITQFNGFQTLVHIDYLP